MIIKVKTFIEEVIAELKKVTWTPRKDLINSTFIVIISAICFGVYITSIDILLTRGLHIIIK